MKYILIALFIVSCKSEPAKKDYSAIEKKIQVHNVLTHLDFTRDSLGEMQKLEIQYVNIKGNKKLLELLDSHGKVVKDEWNTPYSISKDYELTLDKYLEFCKANNKDVETFYKFMR